MLNPLEAIFIVVNLCQLSLHSYLSLIGTFKGAMCKIVHCHSQVVKY